MSHCSHLFTHIKYKYTKNNGNNINNHIHCTFTLSFAHTHSLVNGRMGELSSLVVRRKNSHIKNDAKKVFAVCFLIQNQLFECYLLGTIRRGVLSHYIFLSFLGSSIFEAKSRTKVASYILVLFFICPSLGNIIKWWYIHIHESFLYSKNNEWQYEHELNRLFFSSSLNFSSSSSFSSSS